MAKRTVYSSTRKAFIRKPDLWKNWPGERWERIPNIPQRYYVSNYGRIYREVKRRTKHKNWTLFMVKPHRSRSGWELRIKGKNKYSKMLNLLVADLFQLRPLKGKVLFKDGNRWNCRLSNLTITGQRKHWKITPTQKAFCKERFKTYHQSIIVPELAKRFMVSYLIMWKIYKEFMNENITTGNTAYDHLASDPNFTARKLL